MAVPLRDQRSENSDVWDLFCLFEGWNILLDIFLGMICTVKLSTCHKKVN